MKRKFIFFTAFLTAFLCPVNAYAEEFDAEIKIESKEISRGSETEITIPVNATYNNGISGIMATFDTGELILSEISTLESGMLKNSETEEEFGVFDYINTQSNAVIWSTKNAGNTTNSGNFLNLKFNLENVYPGVYDISFKTEKTMATKQPQETDSLPVAANMNCIGATLTVNGNESDIAQSHIIGDSDMNGEVISDDALRVLQTITGGYTSSIEENIIFDTDFDGKVTSVDALNILNYNVGNISDYSDGTNSASRVGIYLSEDGSEIVHRSYYKDNTGLSVKINYTE